MRWIGSALLILVAPFVAAEDDRRFSGSADPGRRPAAVGDFDRVIPLVIDGGGWKTSLVLTNLDTRTVYFDLFFVGGDGSPLNLPVAGLGSVARVFGSLPINQRLTIETEGTAESVSEGYVSFYTVDRPADDPKSQVTPGRIGALAIVRGSPPDRPGFEAVFAATSMFEARFTLPFDNRSGFRSGLIVVNASVRSSPVTLVVRDERGNVLVRDAGTLEKGQRLAALLVDMYPETADQVGIVQISTSALALSGLGIRLDPVGTLTAVPALSSDVDPEAPARPSTPSASLPGVSAACSALEGAFVFADDGQFLGKITSDTFAADSLGNTFGRYGSEYSPTSIFNPNGKYGGEFSSLSPFNAFATRPPLIFIGSKPVAHLTINQTKTPRIDPRAIYPCIGRR
ncbi:MAG: hypothetical protein AAB403_02120 [Planctomycetota bacterium]